jgi:hypothetical protein
MPVTFGHIHPFQPADEQLLCGIKKKLQVEKAEHQMPSIFYIKKSASDAFVSNTPNRPRKSI